jgi:serine/threonine protein kinase
VIALEIITEFKGHSHCRVYLCRDKKGYFVRKETDDPEYVNRLEAQINKQKLFSNHINTPKILSEEKSKNKFYADMDYIQGENLINYLARCADYKEIISVLDKVLEDITKIKKIKFEGKNNFYESLNKKLGSLQKEVPDLKKVFSVMDGFLNSIKNVELKESACHGDLTFENILISENNKKLYYIDLLDSFFSHYWFDFAKIYQDLEGEWFNIKNPDFVIPKEKILFMKNYLDNQIKIIEPQYFKYHYFLLTLMFLRIIPYATDENILKRVTEKAELFAGKI